MPLLGPVLLEAAVARAAAIVLTRDRRDDPLLGVPHSPRPRQEGMLDVAEGSTCQSARRGAPHPADLLILRKQLHALLAAVLAPCS